MSSLLPDAVLARRDRLPRKPARTVLTGVRVELQPLDLDEHVGTLHAVSCGAPCVLGDRRVGAYDPDKLVWRWMKGGPFANATALRDYLASQVDAPDALPMVVLDLATRSPVGVAAFMSNHPEDLKLELGGIWYGPIAQGTGASREATHLMLAYAFDLGYRRVEWKCDALNERSRRAALSYGFTFEGIQKAHNIVKGRNRDTAWFRMLDHEWSGRETWRP
jgi:RimJ/RimL family protein N-acetyltransferase